LYGRIGQAYPQHTVSQFNYGADAVQLRYFDDVGGSTELWFDELVASLERASELTPNFYYYLAPSSNHCMMGNEGSINDVYTRVVDGVPLIDWITDIVNDEPIQSVTCELCDLTTFDGEWESEEVAYGLVIEGPEGFTTAAIPPFIREDDLILSIESVNGKTFEGQFLFPVGQWYPVAGSLNDTNDELSLSGNGEDWTMVPVE
jgi:hypothetical protein